MTHKYFKINSLALAMACSAAATFYTFSPTAEAFQLEEVVVTAQRREENQQDVPIAITAFSGDSLKEKGLTDIVSVGGSSPNVTLRNSASFGGSSSILVSYIRGIGQNDFAFNVEPGVGVYIDGVYLARNIGANVDLLDIQSVEVLKGPQGTLFGRNSVGGALNIVTRDPGYEFAGRAETSLGSYGRTDFKGAVEIPLVDDELSLGLAMSVKRRDGWQDRIDYNGYTDQNPIYLLATGGATGGPVNTNTDESHRFPIVAGASGDESGDQDSLTLRSKLVWTPTEKFTGKLIADYQKVDQTAAPFSLLQVNQEAYVAIYNTCITGNPAIIGGVAALQGIPGIVDICNNARGSAVSPNGTQPSLASEAGQHLPYDNRYVITDSHGDIDPDKSYASGANFDKLENYGLNVTLDYELTDYMSVKSITAYRELTSEFGVDIGGAPFSALNPTFSDEEEQFSQELHLSGLVMDDRWNYLVGAYYFHEEGEHVDGVPFTGGLIQIWSDRHVYDTKAYALFTHNNIALTDKIGLTVGVRYTEEEKELLGKQRDENAFAAQLFGIPDAATANNDVRELYPLGKDTLDFEDVSYRVGLEYTFDNGTMLYTSVANGYKGGGWTTRLTAPSLDGVAPTFEPEEADTYEIGIKSELFDGMARLNLATFYTEYSDIQLTFQDGTSPVTSNGGDGTIKGIEADFEAVFTDNWTMDASAGYIDAGYDKVKTGVILDGSEDFVNTPQWTLHVGSSYRIDTDVGVIMPRLDWMFQSKSYNDEANTEILSTPSHSIFNGSVTFELPDSAWEVQAGVTNILDERVIVSGYTNAQAIYAATYNRPREWYLTLRASF